MMIPTDPIRHTSVALRWIYRNQPRHAEAVLATLGDEELRGLRTSLLHLAALINPIIWGRPTAHQVAVAILAPDDPSLPDGVEGFEIHGRACDCGLVDCQWHHIHTVPAGAR